MILLFAVLWYHPPQNSREDLSKADFTSGSAVYIKARGRDESYMILLFAVLWYHPPQNSREDLSKADFTSGSAVYIKARGRDESAAATIVVEDHESPRGRRVCNKIK